MGISAFDPAFSKLRNSSAGRKTPATTLARGEKYVGRHFCFDKIFRPKLFYSITHALI